MPSSPRSARPAKASARRAEGASPRDRRIPAGRPRLAAGRSDHRALRNSGATLDRDRPQLKQRRRIPGRRLDRDRLAAGGNGAGKRHGAGHRRAHGRPLSGADVDPAVLAACERMRGIEDERTQDGPVDRPSPRTSRRGNGEGAQQDDRQSTHGNLLRCQNSERNRRYRRDRSLSILATKYDGRARSSTSPSTARRPPQHGGVRLPPRRAPRPRPTRVRDPHPPLAQARSRA